MFENVDELQLALLYRAINTERNTINKLIIAHENLSIHHINEEFDEENMLAIPDEVEGDPWGFRNQRRAILQLQNEVDREYIRRNLLRKAKDVQNKTNTVPEKQRAGKR